MAPHTDLVRFVGVADVEPEGAVGPEDPLQFTEYLDGVVEVFLDGGLGAVDAQPRVAAADGAVLLGPEVAGDTGFSPLVLARPDSGGPRSLVDVVGPQAQVGWAGDYAVDEVGFQGQAAGIRLSNGRSPVGPMGQGASSSRNLRI